MANIQNPIRIDAEFAGLIPPVANAEHHRLEMRLLAEGCRDPLIVWQGHDILLDGHNRFDLCQQHGIAFPRTYIELPDRAAARAYIVMTQLARRNLAGVAASYLRGKHYQAEKLPHGGDRTGEEAIPQSEYLKTAQRLAAQYQVSRATIERDDVFARAVDGIVLNCTAEAKNLILSRDAGLSRRMVFRLARLTPQKQQQFIRILQETGKPPRRKLKKSERMTITLPREPKSCAEKLVERLGREGANAVCRMVKELLRNRTIVV